ncbi:hypothetical protein ABT352_38800 [Streptosporangium sp. NPDC000563]|uniref:hypothetical protein n=1 Tax=Streptosporangium sp. NPDC000563 TaxID=3154366 RepID=UPI00332C3F19
MSERVRATLERDRKVLTLSRILVSALLTLALSGCQSPLPPGESTPEPRATAADKSPTVEIGADTVGLFKRREAPENGVPALLTQSMGADGSGCADLYDEPLELKIRNQWVNAGLAGHLPGKRWTEEPADGNISEFGWPVYLFIAGIPLRDATAEPPKPGDVIIETPSDQRIRSTLPTCATEFVILPGGEYQLAESFGKLTGELLGRYRVILSYDGATVTGEFHMRRSQHPRLITTMTDSPPPDPGSVVRLGVVGVPPYSRQTIGLYLAKSVSMTDFTFQTAFPVQTDANGEATFDLTVPPRPEFGCYLFALNPTDYPTAQDAPIPPHRIKFCPYDRAEYEKLANPAG